MSLTADSSLAVLTDYDIRHIVTHLLWAGPDRDVHRLLDLEIAQERRNGWFTEPEVPRNCVCIESRIGF